MLRGEFQFDDWWVVVRDEATQSWTALAARLGGGVRPLLRLSYYLDHSLWGMVPAGFLATNLALHVGATLLAYALAARRLPSRTAAFLAAAAFAVQPAHAEVVSYLSGRSTGLMAVLLLGGLLAHDLAGQAAGRGRLAREVLSLALFLAACLAKEVALIFPVLAWLWDRTGPEERRSRAGSRLAQGLVALGALATLALSPRYRFLAAYGAALRSPLPSALANARAVPEMLSLWFRPWALSVDHAFDAGPHLAASALGLCLLMGLAGAAWAARRRAPLFSFAVGWLLAALAPTNSLLGKADLVTEKPLYLAWFGPALLLGALLGRLLERMPTGWPARAAWAGLAGVLCSAGVACAARAATWSDARRLWSDAVAKAPGASRAWNNLGMAYFQKGQRAEALASFERAVELEPTNGTARLNLALLHAIRPSEGP